MRWSHTTDSRSEWVSVFEEQTRRAERAYAPFFNNKTQMKASERNAGIFVEIDLDGWNRTGANKMFVIVWADGRRGVVLWETMPVNEASADKAKRDLGQVKAVVASLGSGRAWRREYNEVRPNRSLGNQPPQAAESTIATT